MTETQRRQVDNLTDLHLSLLIHEQVYRSRVIEALNGGIDVDAIVEAERLAKERFRALSNAS